MQVAVEVAVVVVGTVAGDPARWSGGLLASLASHILWTGPMLGLAPTPGREVLRT